MAAATPKQLSYIKLLVDERQVEEPARSQLLERAESGEIERALASDFIGRLKKIPRKPGNEAKKGWVKFPGPDVIPAGRYCVEGADGELKFYKLWRGRRKPDFVKLYVVHGPSESELPFPAYAAIIAKIEADPRAAAIRYGKEIGECCICARRLSNRISRELGIGPVCGGRFYSDPSEWSEVQADARETIEAEGHDPNELVDPEEVVA